MRKRSIVSLLLSLFFSLGAGAALSGCADSNPTFGNQDLSVVVDAGADMSASPAPDLMAVMCQLVPQAGCPAGLKCTTRDAVTTLCDPNGNLNRGELCVRREGADDCYAGNACVANGNGTGMCRTFCRTDLDCGSRRYCELPLGTNGLVMCTQDCNALGAGCPSGLGCYAYGREHTDCRAAGTKAEGQPCVRPEECQPGMACLGPAGGESCRKLCLRGNNGNCRNGQLCYNVNNSDGTTWATYGVCL